MKPNFIDIITETVIRNIKEAHYRNVGDEIEAFNGRRPKTIKARINQIYKLANKYGLSSRKYHDDHWQALKDYDTVISSMGCEFTYWCENGGYTDRDQDGRPMSKVYNIEISYDDGMTIGGYIKMMAAGSMEDPFDAYDTCMILWPKSSVRESKEKKFRISESKLNDIINETIKSVLTETPLDYDVDNFSGRHYKNIPNDYIDTDGYLDDPNDKSEIEYEMSNDPYYDNFKRLKDAENDYSWHKFDTKGIYPGIYGNYTVSKDGANKEKDEFMNTHNNIRDKKENWSDKELRHGKRNMERFVQGKRTPEQIGDNWEDLQYELN